MQPKRRRRFVATTDSDHDNPIFPDLARDRIVDGPNQLWVADITYIAIATRFVYLAAILDAWSRRVVGYAISRSIKRTKMGSWLSEREMRLVAGAETASAATPIPTQIVSNGEYLPPKQTDAETCSFIVQADLVPISGKLSDL